MIKITFLLFCLLWGTTSTIADSVTAKDTGKELYLSYGCALCHGWDGAGDGINALKFDPPPTNFHEPKAYLHGNDRDSIRRSIQYGIKEDNSIMPAFEDIPPAEVDQIISYLQSVQKKEIIVTNAWVQAMPPSQTTSAAYMTITNNSPKDAVLTSASSDIAGTVEIHQMSDMNGMMNMAMVANIHIPAQGKVTLKPGGFHIMLINLKKPVNGGDTVSITLHFQDGSAVTLNAQAKTQEPQGASSMAGMKM